MHSLMDVAWCTHTLLDSQVSSSWCCQEACAYVDTRTVMHPLATTFLR